MAMSGMIALHAHQSWATRHQADGDEHMDKWETAVRFHGHLPDAPGSPTPTIVYVNLSRGLLWPTPKQLRAHSHLQVLFAHLFRDTTVCQAMVIARGPFVRLLTPTRSALITAMATGVWRIMVGKCYAQLLLSNRLGVPWSAGGQTHEWALVSLVRPVTTILSFLCPEQQIHVCWQIDWPYSYF